MSSDIRTTTSLRLHTVAWATCCGFPPVGLATERFCSKSEHRQHAAVSASASTTSGCWPDAAQVTPDGKYIPLARDTPPEVLVKDARWRMGDPARYQVHCSFGFAVDPNGYVLARHEIPPALSRYLPDRVEVLQKDGTWGTGKEFIRQKRCDCCGSRCQRPALRALVRLNNPMETNIALEQATSRILSVVTGLRYRCYG